jgi:hypothetical protein
MPANNENTNLHHNLPATVLRKKRQMDTRLPAAEFCLCTAATRQSVTLRTAALIYILQKSVYITDNDMLTNTEHTGYWNTMHTGSGYGNTGNWHTAQLLVIKLLQFLVIKE